MNTEAVSPGNVLKSRTKNKNRNDDLLSFPFLRRTSYRRDSATSRMMTIWSPL